MITKEIKNIECLRNSISVGDDDFYISINLLNKVTEIASGEINPCVLLQKLHFDRNKNKSLLKFGRRKKEIDFKILDFDNIKIFECI